MHKLLSPSLFARSTGVAFATLLAACVGTQADNPLGIEDQGLMLEPIAEALDQPWGMDFLSDTQILITEKTGQLQQFDTVTGERHSISGLPDSADFGQGGLLDVLVDREEAEVWLYLSYTHEGGEGYTTRVARGRLQDAGLIDVQVLFTAEPFYETKYHFGSRLQIVDDYLFVTVGDRGNRQYAQDLSRHNGKVMRIHKNGDVPDENPFTQRAGARPEIWTYGHRNPQGLARHPDGSLWVSEHGPQGGDELNRLEAGTNYGWPIITYGEEYGGGAIGEGTSKPGMAQPEKYYVPSIATCGMDFNDATHYPQWKPSAFVSSLKLTHLNRVELTSDGLGEETRYFASSGLRFRDVQTGPDGYVYVLAGSGLYRVVPGRG